MGLSRRRFTLGVLGAGLAACSGRRREPESAITKAVPPLRGASPPTRPMDPARPADPEPPESLPSPPAPALRGDPFGLGVGSGDPVPDGVVLWTRVLADTVDGTAPGLLTLVWEVALPVGPGDAAADEDDGAGFERPEATGTVDTGPDVGHSVHVEVDGLDPDRWYRYRFRLGPWTSPVGRTRTAPAPDARPGALRLALASCQDWQSGHYAAYRHLVDDRPDLVVFGGDYIYEGDPTPGAARLHDGPEPTTLEGYRARYARYRSDPALQAAHAACPWVATWDDHEVVDGYAGPVGRAGPGAGGGTAGQAEDPAATAGPGDGEAFLERRAAAYRAWWEHMAVRGPAPSGPDLTVHRSLRWGRLAQLIVLDGRQFRSPRPCGDGLVPICEAREAEEATLLGLDQEAWLAERLAEAGAGGVVWTTLVNPVLLTELVVPATPGGSPQFYADAWDGYPAARRRLLTDVERSGVTNLVALTGDLHASVVGDLRLDGRTVGTEFLGPGITSPFPAGRVDLFGLAPALLPQVVAADGRYRGYVLCRVDAEGWRAEYRWVQGVDRPDAALVGDAPAFMVEAGRPGARRVAGTGR